MLFNSVAFLVLFPTVTVLYHSLFHRLCWVALPAASYLFHGYWRLDFPCLIALGRLVTSVSARWKGRDPTPWQRRPYLAFARLVDLGALGTFKRSVFAALQAVTPIPVVSRPEDHLFTWRLFCDTVYQLNTEGRQRRATRLITGLRRALGLPATGPLRAAS